MSNPPIATKKLYPIEVAIWGGQYGANISIKKRFKDKQTGQYKETNFLSVNEAIVAHRLLGDAITLAIRSEEENQRERQRPTQRQQGEIDNFPIADNGDPSDPFDTKKDDDEVTF